MNREEISNRLKICFECDYLILKSICGKCGCPVHRKSKKKYWDCPLGKWAKESKT